MSRLCPMSSPNCSTILGLLFWICCFMLHHFHCLLALWLPGAASVHWGKRRSWVEHGLTCCSLFCPSIYFCYTLGFAACFKKHISLLSCPITPPHPTTDPSHIHGAKHLLPAVCILFKQESFLFVRGKWLLTACGHFSLNKVWDFSLALISWWKQLIMHMWLWVCTSAESASPPGALFTPIIWFVMLTRSMNSLFLMSILWIICYVFCCI